MKFKKTFFAVLFLTLLIAVAVIFRIQFIHWAVATYFAQKNIKIEFKINHLGFSAVSLKDVVMDGHTKIESIEVSLASLRPLKLSALQLVATQLDLDEVSKLSEKINKGVVKKQSESPARDDDKPTSFVSLSGSCAQLELWELDIRVGSIVYQKKEVPLGLRVHKKQNASTFVELKGSLTSSPFAGSLKFRSADYHLNGEVQCGSDKIRILLPSVAVHLQKAKGASDLVVERADWNVENGVVEVLPVDDFTLDFPGQLKIDLEKHNAQYFHGQTRLQILGKAQLANPQAGNAQVKLSSLRLGKPFPIRLAAAVLDFKKSSTDTFSITGKYSLRNLDYLDEKRQPLVEGLHLAGSFSLLPDKYSARFRATDKSGVLHFRQGDIVYTPAKGNTKFTLAAHKNFIEVNDRVSSLLPEYKEWEIKGNGRVFLGGSIQSKNDKWVGKIAVEGKEINISTKQGYVKNLNFSHDILEYPRLASSILRSVRADEVGFGPVLNDLVLSYQVHDLSKIYVAKFSFYYEEAFVIAQSFIVDAKRMKMKELKADVTNLSLEKLLKLPLGETITAHGKLNGRVNLEVEKNVPVVNGFLRTSNNGWIRYRKTEGQPKLSLSTSPMEILEGYLYDFVYTDLEVDIVSDTAYDLKMTLRVFGKNPNFVGGKPLKLNVNVEQNLLAAFEAMMLTYTMQEKIEKQFENIGTEK